MRRALASSSADVSLFSAAAPATATPDVVGASLLMRALASSTEQLYVPLFMLLVMVISFSTVLYTMEFSPAVHDCKQHWVQAGGWPRLQGHLGDIASQ